ncbi:T9SS type A sorting domain-containing protein [Candidatus Zixiibacteriota bacterium]
MRLFSLLISLLIVLLISHSIIGQESPFCQNSTVKVEIPTETKLKITLYDIFGEKVGIIYDSLFQGYGEFTIDSMWMVDINVPNIPDTTFIDGNKLEAGIYFYKMETGDTVITKKMVLLK